MFVCLAMEKCTAHRGQKRGGGSDPLKLELQVVVSCYRWVLGTELRSLQEQNALLTAEPSPLPTSHHLLIRFVLIWTPLQLWYRIKHLQSPLLPVISPTWTENTGRGTWLLLWLVLMMVNPKQSNESWNHLGDAPLGHLRGRD